MKNWHLHREHDGAVRKVKGGGKGEQECPALCDILGASVRIGVARERWGWAVPVEEHVGADFLWEAGAF